MIRFWRRYWRRFWQRNARMIGAPAPVLPVEVLPPSLPTEAPLPAQAPPARVSRFAPGPAYSFGGRNQRPVWNRPVSADRSRTAEAVPAGHRRTGPTR